LLALGFMVMQLFGGEVVGAAVQEALGDRLRPAGEGVDAVPAGRVQAHTAASLRRFPVEGLLPCRIQVPFDLASDINCLVGVLTTVE
jgi:hypothetical protein